MKKYATLILILFAIQNLTAQKHYFEGFIVQPDGDTIKGFIGYNNWNDNPDYVNYRSTKEGQTIKYLPHEILAFGVNEDLFESSFVYHEISPRATEILKFNPDLQLEQKQVFLRILYKGEKTLALYKTHSGIDNYYIYYDNKYQLLIYKKYFQQEDGKNGVKTNKKYLGQLRIYLDNCSAINSRISSVKYCEESMVKLFKNYYSSCTNETIVHTAKKEKDILVWSILAGVVDQKVKVNQLLLPYPVEFSAGTNFTFGGALDIFFKRSLGRFSFNNELIFTILKASAEAERVVTYRYKWHLNYTYLNMNNMLRYQYKIGKMNLFANIGLTTGLVLKGSSYLEKDNVVTGKQTVSDIGFDKKLESGLLFGIGARFNEKYQMEIRYQKSTGMSSLPGLHAPIQRIFFMFSYRF